MKEQGFSGHLKKSNPHACILYFFRLISKLILLYSLLHLYINLSKRFC